MKHQAAYFLDIDLGKYSVTESIYEKTEDVAKVIRKGQKISFVPEEGNRKPLATEVRG